MRSAAVFICECAILQVLVVGVGARDACVTVRTVDDAGLPIEGATVSAGFETSIAAGLGWGSGQPITVMRQTDSNGLCTVRSGGSGAEVGLAAMKEGFYTYAGLVVEFNNIGGFLGSRWQPWNPVVTMSMQRIVNPIPLISKWQGFARSATPLESGMIAYDFMKGDWVQPYGTGEVRDFIFQYGCTLGAVTKSGYQLHESSLELRFANEGDGILVTSAPARPERGPRIPTQAPLEGYATNWTSSSYLREDVMSPRPSSAMCYYFRVRSQKSPDGAITNCLYGKIYGPIEHPWCGGRLGVRFLYYLNPTPNDRNLEFDQNRNLLPEKDGPYLPP